MRLYIQAIGAATLEGSTFVVEARAMLRELSHPDVVPHELLGALERRPSTPFEKYLVQAVRTSSLQ